MKKLSPLTSIISVVERNPAKATTYLALFAFGFWMVAFTFGAFHPDWDDIVIGTATGSLGGFGATSNESVKKYFGHLGTLSTLFLGFLVVVLLPFVPVSDETKSQAIACGIATGLTWSGLRPKSSTPRPSSEDVVNWQQFHVTSGVEDSQVVFDENGNPI